MLSKNIVKKIKSKSVLSEDELTQNLLEKTFFGQDILTLAIKYSNSAVFIDILTEYEKSVDNNPLFGFIMADISQDILINLDEFAIKKYIEVCLNSVDSIHNKWVNNYNGLENLIAYDDAIAKVYGRLIEEGYKDDSSELLRELTKSDFVHNKILYSILDVSLNVSNDDEVINKILKSYKDNKNKQPNKEHLQVNPDVLNVSFVAILLRHISGQLVKKMIVDYDLDIKVLKEKSDIGISKYSNEDQFLNHPLYVATVKKDYDFIMYLLDKGTDVSLFNGSSKNYIWDELLSHNDVPLEVFDKLLDFGYSIAKVNGDLQYRYARNKESSALSLLVTPNHRNIELFKHIFEYISDKYFSDLPNELDKIAEGVSNYEVLMEIIKVAVVNNDVVALEYMLNKFTENNQYKDDVYKIFFIEAAKYAKIEVIKLLENYGIDLYVGVWDRENENSKSKYSYNLMDLSAEYHNYDVATYLLKSAKNKDLLSKKSFFYNEEYLGNFLVRVLRSSASSIGGVDFINEVVQDFKNRGLYIDQNLTIDIYKENKRNTYPLGVGFLISSWDEKIVDGIYSSSVNINSKDVDGRGILYYMKDIRGSHRGDDKVNKIFSEYNVLIGCDMNHIDGIGNTPLHQLNVLHLDYIHKLLDFGIDYTIKNNDGKTIYDNLFENTDRNLVYWESNISLTKLNMFFDKTSDIFLENYDVLKQSLNKYNNKRDQEFGSGVYHNILDVMEYHFLKLTVNKPTKKNNGHRV